MLKVDLHNLGGVNSLSGTQVCGLGVVVSAVLLPPAEIPELSDVASVELSSAINENQLVVF